MTTLRALLAAVVVFITGPVGHLMAQSADILLAAAEHGDVESARASIAAGARLEARDERGRTALLIATHRDDAEMARLLIAAGADVNAKDTLHDSPYLYAAAEGRLDILRMTLAAGADLKSVNRYGGTGLIPAAHHGHIDIVRELLKTRIAIDHVNRLGWTALLEAVILGDGGPVYIEIVHMLINARANVNLADSNGVGPLAHAERRGFREIALVLRAAGAQ